MAEVRRGTESDPYGELPPEEAEVTEENVFDVYDEPQGFFPNQIMADLTVSAVLMALVLALSFFVPAPLTEPIDVSTAYYVPRPEWFFMFLDQWLIFFPGSALIAFGDVILPAVFAIVLFALPWLDREPAHSPARRPFVVMVSFLIMLVIVLNLFLAVSRIANFTGGSPAG